MAHQTHNLPWNTLASNFVYIYRNPCEGGVTDLFPRGKPGQGKQLNYFAGAFARTMQEHAESERRKWPETFDPPEPEDVILSDAVVKKISATVRRYSSKDDYSILGSNFPRTMNRSYTGQLCNHQGSESACHCPIAYEERKSKFLAHKFEQNDCYQFFDVNGEAYRCLELVKTLLLHGELESVLQIVSNPAADYHTQRRWEIMECQCSSEDLGWGSICNFALMAYLALNLLYCFPSLHNRPPAEQSRIDSSGPVEDYRETRMYQKMLARLTKECTSEVSTYPHRQFFGIHDEQFRPDYERTQLYGVMSSFRFLTKDVPYRYAPTAADVGEVRSILRRKGLPAELALQIMELAEYTGSHRLEIPDDPLHFKNGAELKSYLTYCWKLLIRSDVMAKACGSWIDWSAMVKRCLVALAPLQWGKMWRRNDDDVQRDRGNTPINVRWGGDEVFFV